MEVNRVTPEAFPHSPLALGDPLGRGTVCPEPVEAKGVTTKAFLHSPRALRDPLGENECMPGSTDLFFRLENSACLGEHIIWQR